MSHVTALPTRVPSRRSFLLSGLGLVGMPAWLAGCASLAGEYTLSQAQLLQALIERFPVQRRFAEVFELRLTRPSLRLIPDENRLGLGLAVGLRETLLTRRDFTGQWAFSSGLRFDPSDASVRLSEVRTEDLAIDGLPEQLAMPVRLVGGRVVEEVLEGTAVHRFNDSVARRARQLGIQPDALRVTDTGVTLKLTPSTP